MSEWRGTDIHVRRDGVSVFADRITVERSDSGRE